MSTDYHIHRSIDGAHVGLYDAAGPGTWLATLTYGAHTITLAGPA